MRLHSMRAVRSAAWPGLLLPWLPWLLWCGLAAGRALVESRTEPGAAECTTWRTYNVGVLMASRLDSPFDLERCGPAVDLALEVVNEQYVKHHCVRLNKVQKRWVSSARSLFRCRWTV